VKRLQQKARGRDSWFLQTFLGVGWEMQEAVLADPVHIDRIRSRPRTSNIPQIGQIVQNAIVMAQNVDIFKTVR
jgi:hypothetical protein